MFIDFPRSRSREGVWARLFIWCWAAYGIFVAWACGPCVAYVTLGEPPFAGLRVLELASMVAAPIVSRTLADWGAEVGIISNFGCRAPGSRRTPGNRPTVAHCTLRQMAQKMKMLFSLDVVVLSEQHWTHARCMPPLEFHIKTIACTPLSSEHFERLTLLQAKARSLG